MTESKFHEYRNSIGKPCTEMDVVNLAFISSHRGWVGYKTEPNAKLEIYDGAPAYVQMYDYMVPIYSATLLNIFNIWKKHKNSEAKKWLESYGRVYGVELFWA